VARLEGLLSTSLYEAYRKQEKASEKVPKNMTSDDWKWLLHEHFFSPKFQVRPQFVFSFCRKSLFLFAL